MNTKNKVALVACSSMKSSVPKPAGEFYEGSLHKKQLTFAQEALELTTNQIYIVSAKYELVPLTTVIEPYDVVLSSLSPSQRRVWGRNVVNSLLERHPDVELVYLMAGKYYRDAVEPFFKREGIQTLVPHPTHLGIGSQMAWYDKEIQTARDRKALTPPNKGFHITWVMCKLQVEVPKYFEDVPDSELKAFWEPVEKGLQEYQKIVGGRVVNTWLTDMARYGLLVYQVYGVGYDDGPEEHDYLDFEVTFQVTRDDLITPEYLDRILNSTFTDPEDATYARALVVVRT